MVSPFTLSPYTLHPESHTVDPVPHCLSTIPWLRTPSRCPCVQYSIVSVCGNHDANPHGKTKSTNFRLEIHLEELTRRVEFDVDVESELCRFGHFVRVGGNVNVWSG